MKSCKCRNMSIFQSHFPRHLYVSETRTTVVWTLPELCLPVAADRHNQSFRDKLVMVFQLVSITGTSFCWYLHPIWLWIPSSTRRSEGWFIAVRGVPSKPDGSSAEPSTGRWQPTVFSFMGHEIFLRAEERPVWGHNKSCIFPGNGTPYHHHHHHHH